MTSVKHPPSPKRNLKKELRAQFKFRCENCNQEHLMIITKAQAKRIYQALQAGSTAEVNRLLQLVGGITIKKEEQPRTS